MMIEERFEEDTSWKARPYHSSTMEDTLKEISLTKVTSNKPLLRMQFIKKRKDFGQPYKFTENDTEKTLEFKATPLDPLADKETKVL